MRVISGIWRGRRLHVDGPGARGLELRPTTDRVKEALFAGLGDRVRDAAVVDLCCGAGGLGIEALSRGAARCHFVDVEGAALAIARRNLDRCGAARDSYKLLRGDAVSRLARLADGVTPLLVLSDPPYGPEPAEKIWKTMLAKAVDGVLSLAVLEHLPEQAFDAPPAGWTHRRRRYGNTELSFLEPE